MENARRALCMGENTVRDRSLSTARTSAWMSRYFAINKTSERALTLYVAPCAPMRVAAVGSN